MLISAQLLVGLACFCFTAPAVEQPLMPLRGPAQCPFQLEVTVLSIEEKWLTDQPKANSDRVVRPNPPASFLYTLTLTICALRFPN